MPRRVGLQTLLIAPVAVDPEDPARVRRDDLAELEGARRRIREILYPVDAHRARPIVGYRLERRIVRMPHVAAGHLGLLGLPLLLRALHGDRLDPRIRIGAAHSVERAVDQVARWRRARAGTDRNCEQHHP
jgi:hypothetical protein